MSTRKPAMPGQKPITGMPAALAEARWAMQTDRAVHDLADTITSEWLERCRHRPPSKTRAQVREEIRQLVIDGIDPDMIRRGTAAWMHKGYAPSALASFVNAALNAAPARPARGQLVERDGMVLSQRSIDSLELIERMRALDEAEAAGGLRAVGGA